MFVINGNVFSRAEYPFIENGDLSKGIIHRIVCPFLQRRAPGIHFYRSLCDVKPLNDNVFSRSCLERTHDPEFVFCGNKFGLCLGSVVQFAIGIFLDEPVPYGGVCFFAEQVAQGRIKRVEVGEDDKPSLPVYGEFVHKVKVAIGLGVVIGVEAVEAQYFDELLGP